MVKTFQKYTSPKPAGLWPLILVYIVSDSGPTIFVQTMNMDDLDLDNKVNFSL